MQKQSIVTKGEILEDTIEKCGAPAVGGPCVLNAGHNMGQLDIPTNHRAMLTLSNSEIDDLQTYFFEEGWTDFSDPHARALVVLCWQAKLANR